jgi:hypothetical protein
MTGISLGENSKLTALASERDRILRFFGDGLNRQPGRKKMSAAAFLKRYKIRNNKPRRNYHEPICLSLSRRRGREIP